MSWKFVNFGNQCFQRLYTGGFMPYHKVLLRRPWILYSALLFVTCFVCYFNTLSCAFVFDDISAVRDNKDLRPSTPIVNLLWNDFWGTPMHKEQSHKSYRPLCIATFRFNYFIHELQPMGYHLVNVLLHATVTIVYYWFCLLFLSPNTSVVAALLFAVHPIHTEAVAGVVGRAETLCAFFFLMSFLSYHQCTKKLHSFDCKHLLLCLLSMAASMLCKEQGITVVAVCIVYEIFIVQKFKISYIFHPYQSWLYIRRNFRSTWSKVAIARTALLVLSATGLLMVRVKLMGSQLPVFTRFDNPASVAPTPIRQLTYNYLLAVNAWLLLFPSPLCCDWTMGTIPLINGPLDLRNVATAAFYVVFTSLSLVAFSQPNSPKGRIILMSLSLMVFPFLPASNLFFPVGFVIAERILYTPSMGFCMLVSQGANCLSIIDCKKFPRLLKIIIWTSLILLITFHSAKTVTRNKDWESEYSIFMAGLKVNNRNAKLFNNVGHALESQENFTVALLYFKKAVSVQPDDIGAHINVGRTYNNLKMYKKAEEAYVKAKNLLPRPRAQEAYQTRVAPSHLNVFLNLGNLVARNLSRLEEADALYRQAISMRSDYTQAYINRGDVLIKMKRTEEARQVYEKALQYDSSNADIYYNLGVVYLEQGKSSEALIYLDRALEFDPDHQQALMNSAILIQESGNPHLRKTAYDRLLKLMQKDNFNERIFFNLGMLAMDDGDTHNAEQWFKKAVQVNNF
ncbi:hypothetical protein CHUAL_005973 [Chamberlinius hualienensis]